MPLAAEAEYLRRNPKGQLRVGVAVDGSLLADAAFDAAAAVLKPGATLVVLHIAPVAAAAAAAAAAASAAAAGDGKRALPTTATAAAAAAAVVAAAAPPVPGGSSSCGGGGPRHLQPRALASRYDARAFSAHVPMRFVSRAKQPGESTCEALVAAARQEGVDLLFVGSFGRKGDHGVDLLGSVSDHALREAHASIAIVRSTAPPHPEGPAAPRLLMFATDGSRAAALAWCALLHGGVARPQDRVLLATCSYDGGGGGGGSSSGGGGNVSSSCSSAGGSGSSGSGSSSSSSGGGGGERDRQLAEYMQLARRLGACAAVDAVGVALRRDESVADGLLRVARARGVDVLCVGVAGYGKAKLGSVSEELTRRATMSTIVFKDSWDVLGGGGGGGDAGGGQASLAGDCR